MVAIVKIDGRKELHLAAAGGAEVAEGDGHHEQGAAAVRIGEDETLKGRGGAGIRDDEDLAGGEETGEGKDGASARQLLMLIAAAGGDGRACSTDLSQWFMFYS